MSDERVEQVRARLKTGQRGTGSTANAEPALAALDSLERELEDLRAVRRDRDEQRDLVWKMNADLFAALEVVEAARNLEHLADSEREDFSALRTALSHFDETTG